MAIKIGGPATSEIARYAAAKSPPEAVEGLRNLAAEDRGLGLGGLGPLTLLGMFGTQLHNMLDYTSIIIYLNLYSFMQFIDTSYYLCIRICTLHYVVNQFTPPAVSQQTQLAT